MPIKGNQVIGLKIISINDGQELAHVKDLIYDPKQNKVEGFLIEGKGLFKDAKLVSIEDVKSIGKDAVMVGSSAAVRESKEMGERISDIAQHNQNLTKTNVITEDGTELGKVSDLLFDPATGMVTAFELSKGVTAKVSDIVTVGKDATIVRNYAREDIESQKQQTGVRGMVNQINEKTQEWYNQGRTKAQATGDQAKLKAHLAGMEAKDAQSDMPDMPSGEQAKQKGQQAQNVIGEKIKEMREKLSSKVDEIRIKDALGKYVSVNVLSPNDEIIAKRGDMITNELVAKADQEGVLDKILNNNVKEPVKS